MERIGRRLAGVEVTEVDDRFFLLHPDSARVVVLNVPAAAIWDACGQAETLEEVAQAVAAEFGMAPSEIEGQVADTVRQLAEAGFLVAG